jgi:hypothetical protein
MGILSRTGRPAGEIIYDEVAYSGKVYVVAYLKKNDVIHHFIIDRDDYDTVSKYSWHVISDNYIATTVDHDGKRKPLYLHNLIMKRDAFNGKGQTESVDHINRKGCDNRKENLRLITQTEQNINQVKKKRSVILPSTCGIQPEEIPRHIWYVRANGLHGDRFAIEFKTEGIVWKTTSSKKVSLADKLAQAKEKLEELYGLYPHLNPEVAESESVALLKSYGAILGITD